MTGCVLNTARFLMGDDETARLAEDLRGFRRALLNIRDGGVRPVDQRKRRIEKRLRRFMVRTERLAVSADRNGMLEDRHMAETRLTADDVRAYAVVDHLSQKIGAGNVMEYWKSAPYLLNFMTDYVLKRDLRAAADDPASSPDIAAVIDDNALLPHAAIEAYERVDPGNARLRGLAAETVDAGTWRLLWLPPSLPYYQGRGAYSDPALSTMTKRLIFSSWNVVPDAVSMLLSYEAERAMMRTRGDAARNTAEERGKLHGLLTIRRQDGRVAGMSTFGLLYPSVTLARVADPLAIARELGGAALPSAEAMLAEATRRIEKVLAPATRRAPTAGPEDPRWYWAAPLLLDRRRAMVETSAWLANLATSPVAHAPDAADGASDDVGAWAEHVALARSVVDSGGVLGVNPLGHVPADLAHTLALVALGGPGNCALRALSRGHGRIDDADHDILNARRDAALRIAWGFRSLYNVPEVMALLRGSAGSDEDAYWRRCAEEGVNGNLQAVLDEYWSYPGLVDR